MKAAAPKSVDAYLADFKGAHRKTLNEIRKIIRTTAPKAEEGISYGMPGYKLNGVLVYFAGFKSHCSFFGASKQLIGSIAELKPYQTGPGTLRFEPGQRLPVTTIRKLIRGRMKENEARVLARKKKASR